MTEKTKKATFNLHPEVLAALDEAMVKGAAPSKNALVERALVKELKELDRQTRQARWRDAAKDKLLLKDIAEIETAFQSADAEAAGGIR
ncbi:MAG: hypothetical protein Q7T05_00250 [Dehalococcoidia bacterium]|nr:hypothetical protein [Dehalococcoidia bacterium]